MFFLNKQCKYTIRFLLLALLTLANDGAYADNISKVLSKHSQTIASIEGSFTQEKYISILPAPIISTGTFHFEKEQGIIWKTKSPIESQLKLSSDGIQWQNKEELSSAPNGSDIIANIFLRVISGDLSQLNTFFDISEEGSLSNWRLTLSPNNQNISNHIKQIIIQGKEITEQITIAEQNGDNTIIQLDNNNITYLL